MVFNLGGSHNIGGGNDAVMDSLDVPNPKPVRRILGVRLVSALLDFLPSFTIAATIVSDCGWAFKWRWIGNHFFVSPFRLQEAAPTLLTVDPYFYVADGFALLVLVILTFMSFRIRSYEDGIRDLFDQMYGKLQEAGLHPRWAPKPKPAMPPQSPAAEATAGQ